MLYNTDAAIAAIVAKLGAVAPDAWAEMVYGQFITGVTEALSSAACCVFAACLLRVFHKWSPKNEDLLIGGRMLLGGGALAAAVSALILGTRALQHLLAPTASAIYSIL